MIATTYFAGTSALGKPAIACAAVALNKGPRRSPPASGPARERAGGKETWHGREERHQ
jgi:hypothetical protein